MPREPDRGMCVKRKFSPLEKAANRRNLFPAKTFLATLRIPTSPQHQHPCLHRRRGVGAVGGDQRGSAFAQVR